MRKEIHVTLFPIAMWDKKWVLTDLIVRELWLKSNIW